MTHPVPCCCDRAPEIVVGRPCTPRTATCTQFPSGMASNWELAVAGVIDDSCTGCSPWNRTVTLEYVSGCAFLSGFAGSAFFTTVNNKDAGTPCEVATNCNWIMTYGGVPAAWVLIARTFANTVENYHYIIDGTFKPFGPNTFVRNPAFAATDDDACAFPDELTVEPVCA